MASFPDLKKVVTKTTEFVGEDGQKFIIKGEWFLKTDGASFKTTAMFCQDIEEAKALRNIFGDVVQA